MRVAIIFLIIIAGGAAVLLMTPKKGFQVQPVESEVSPEVVKKDLAKETVHSGLDPLKILDKKCSECHGRKKTKGSFNIVRLLDSGLKQEESD